MPALGMQLELGAGCQLAGLGQAVAEDEGVVLGLDDQRTRTDRPEVETAGGAAVVVVGIGETGLDYFYGDGDLTWQRDRFVTHIEAAKAAQLPLIIHTRGAKEDTLNLLRDVGQHQVTGVLHCFTEDLDMAKQAIELGFYISISGIVTFNNASALREVAKKVPDDRLLIETDAPYLAPVPHRGRRADHGAVMEDGRRHA